MHVSYQKCFHKRIKKLKYNVFRFLKNNYFHLVITIMFDMKERHTSVFLMKDCDNTYSLGKYSPNSKNYCPESGTPTSKRGRAKGERVKATVKWVKGTREGPRSSLPMHSQVKVVCHLKCNTFLMKDFIPSEFVCNFIYSDNILK